MSQSTGRPRESQIPDWIRSHIEEMHPGWRISSLIQGDLLDLSQDPGSSFVACLELDGWLELKPVEASVQGEAVSPPAEPQDFVQWANEQQEGLIPEPMPGTICLPWLYESTGDSWSVSFFGHSVWDSEGDEAQNSEEALEAASDIAQNAAAWGRREVAPREITSEEVNQVVLSALRDALAYIERNHCEHEETHRGGAIWEICDGCGEAWADDKGGKPVDAGDLEPKIQAAQAVLFALEQEIPLRRKIREYHPQALAVSPNGWR